MLSTPRLVTVVHTREISFKIEISWLAGGQSAGMAGISGQRFKVVWPLTGTDFQVLPWHYHRTLHVHLVCECADILWRSPLDYHCELPMPILLDENNDCMWVLKLQHQCHCFNSCSFRKDKIQFGASIWKLKTNSQEPACVFASLLAPPLHAAACNEPFKAFMLSGSDIPAICADSYD